MPLSTPTSRLALCAALAIVPLAAAMAAREKPLEVKSADEKLVGPLNVASLNRLTLAGLGGTPGELGTFLPAFDRRTDTAYTAKEAGPATLLVTFRRPQTLHALRLLFGAGRYEWSAAVAESAAELETKTGGYKVLLPQRTSEALAGTGADTWVEAKLPEPTVVTALQLNLKALASGQKVTLREVNLIGEQKLEAISVRAPGNVIPIGEQVPLEATGFFSGGEARLIGGKALQWTVRPDTAARFSTHARIVGRRHGPIEVTVSLGKLVSPPLQLQVTDSD